jgi:hypothetical protein
MRRNASTTAATQQNTLARRGRRSALADHRCCGCSERREIHRRRGMQELGNFLCRPEVPLGHEAVQFMPELLVPPGIPDAIDPDEACRIGSVAMKLTELKSSFMFCYISDIGLYCSRN